MFGFKQEEFVVSYSDQPKRMIVQYELYNFV